MKKAVYFFCLSLLYSGSTFGQGNKAFYGELGGNGILFSANYDMRFTKHDNGLGFRAGLGFAGVSGVSIFTFPVGLNYITGKGEHHMEVSFCVTPLTGTTTLFDSRLSASTVFYLPSLGYRYGKPGKGFVGRVVVGPIITSGSAYFPWGGISAGIKF